LAELKILSITLWKKTAEEGKATKPRIRQVPIEGDDNVRARTKATLREKPDLLEELVDIISSGMTLQQLVAAARSKNPKGKTQKKPK
jgi:hypothetical protein